MQSIMDGNEKKEKALGIKFGDDLSIGDLVTWKDLGKHSKKKY